MADAIELEKINKHGEPEKHFKKCHAPLSSGMLLSLGFSRCMHGFIITTTWRLCMCGIHLTCFSSNAFIYDNYRSYHRSGGPPRRRHKIPVQHQAHCNIGHIQYAAAISVDVEGSTLYTLDCAMFLAAEAKVRDEFKGNDIDLGAF
jgi:hypothetical protein